MSSAQWANIGHDEGAIHALMQRVPEQVAVEQMDYVWIFPPRRVATGDSIVVVVAAFDEDPERRRVITARFTVSRNRKGAASVNARFDEHGAAPADAVPRIVQGVLRRLGEEAFGEPRAEQILRSADRWSALIVDLGGRPPVEPAVEGGVPEEVQESAQAAPAAADAAAPDTEPQS
jgi:hypothetical protein